MLKTNMTKMNWKVLLTRWIIAGSLLLALFTKSIEAKAAITESRFSELATLPTMTGVAQSSIPDYIAQAQAAVKKYYPQYEEYFDPIFMIFSQANKDEISIINKKIYENFDIFSEELQNNKDKIATILITLENLIWQNVFSNALDINEGKNKYINSKEIAKEIVYDINSNLLKWLKETKEIIERKTNQINKINTITKTLNAWKTETRDDILNLLVQIEDFFLEIDSNWIKNSKWLQSVIQSYISLNKKINREPNAEWNKVIDEYNKITKQ